jgi:hypothetical protein
MPGWSRSRRREGVANLNRKRGGNAAFFCAAAQPRLPLASDDYGWRPSGRRGMFLIAAEACLTVPVAAAI